MTPLDVRNHLPFLKDLIYLDSASVVPSPIPVIEAMNEYYFKFPFNYGVGVFSASREAAAHVDSAREKVAGFIRAGSEKEIVFTKNTTEAINLVARGIDWNQGDEIIITNIEHQSNILPWMRVQKKNGVVLKIAKAEKDGLLRPQTIAELVSNRTRLITVTHVSNIFGTIQPVKEISQIARQRGAWFMVDAAQSAGRVPIDVQEIGCHFMCLCGRKGLMGPQGTGCLYVRKEIMETIEPLIVGSRSGNVKAEDAFEYAPVPHRLEAGVLNTVGVIGLGRAIDYLVKIGMDNIRIYIQELTRKMLEVLLNIEGVEVYGCTDAEKLAGIISWNFKERRSAWVAAQLDRASRIAAASGSNGSLLALRQVGTDEAVRTSVHYFNTPEDIGILAETVTALVKSNPI